MLAYGSRGGSDEPGLSDALASRYVRPSKQTYRKVSPLDSNVRWVRVDFRTVQYARTLESDLFTTLTYFVAVLSLALFLGQSNTEEFSSCLWTRLVDLTYVVSKETADLKLMLLR